MKANEIISAIFSCAALIVSIITFALNYQNARRSSVLARKPVLVFEYQGDFGWALRNVGSGPALNVVVAQRLNGQWFNPVRIPPLSKEGTFILRWLGHVNTTGLGATYTDTEDLPYTSICGKDLNKVTSGLLFGPWPEAEIGKYWNQPLYQERHG